jgi:hypothetical protein
MGVLVRFRLALPMRTQPKFSLNFSDSLSELGQILHDLGELIERWRHLVGCPIRNVRSLASLGHDQAVALQGSDCLLGRIRCHTVHFGETTDGGERVAGCETTSGDVGTDQVGELVLRCAGIGRCHESQVTCADTRGVAQRLTHSPNMSQCVATPNTRSWRASMEENEPTGGELLAIEAEWPRIAAELAVLDAEIAAMQPGAESSELSRRRLRRAQAQLTRQIAADARREDEIGGAA